MIQDLSGSWCIKGTGESMTRVDSSVPLIHHDPDRSWITDPDSDHSKGTISCFFQIKSTWKTFPMKVRLICTNITVLLKRFQAGVHLNIL